MSSYRMSREPSDRKVFLGDLPRDIRKDEVRDVCEKYGRVLDVWLARKPPGFGFAEFEDKRDASDAVHELDGRKVFGRRIRAEISTDRSRRGGGGPKSDARCYECNERGHYARECRDRRGKRSRRDRSYSRDRSPSPRRDRSGSRTRRSKRSGGSSDRGSERRRSPRRSGGSGDREPPRHRQRSASRSRSPSSRKSRSRSRSVSVKRRSRSNPRDQKGGRHDKPSKRRRTSSGSPNGDGRSRQSRSASPRRRSNDKEWD